SGSVVQLLFFALVRLTFFTGRFLGVAVASFAIAASEGNKVLLVAALELQALEIGEILDGRFQVHPATGDGITENAGKTGNHRVPVADSCASAAGFRANAPFRPAPLGTRRRSLSVLGTVSDQAASSPGRPPPRPAPLGTRRRSLSVLGAVSDQAA